MSSCQTAKKPNDTKNMKTEKALIIHIFLGTMLLASLGTPAFAASKNKLDARVRDLTDYFATVQRDPSKAVPAEILSKAEGIVIMRNYKAGFIVGLSLIHI